MFAYLRVWTYCAFWSFNVLFSVSRWLHRRVKRSFSSVNVFTRSCNWWTSSLLFEDGEDEVSTLLRGRLRDESCSSCSSLVVALILEAAVPGLAVGILVPWWEAPAAGWSAEVKDGGVEECGFADILKGATRLEKWEISGTGRFWCSGYWLKRVFFVTCCGCFRTQRTVKIQNCDPRSYYKYVRTYWILNGRGSFPTMYGTATFVRQKIREGRIVLFPVSVGWLLAIDIQRQKSQCAGAVWFRHSATQARRRVSARTLQV